MFSLKELKSEWKKIVWPGKKELAQKTGIVIIVCTTYHFASSATALIPYFLINKFSSKDRILKKTRS